MTQTLKKINAGLMCIIILLTSINLNVLIENISLLDIQSIFSSEISKKYENKTLMVTAKTKEFNNYGAESVEKQDEIYILKYKTAKETKLAYEKMQEEKEIEEVEINASMEIQREEKAYEAQIERLTSKIETRKEEEKEIKETELAKYLNEKESKKEIKVAILDTGVNLSDEELKQRIININKNLSTTGEEGSIQDDNGHGTEMAKIIAKNTNEKVKIIPIKVANREGKSTILDAYKGIKEAIERGADIINISMNALQTEKSKILEDIIKEASKKGIKVVVSAGNNGMDVKKVIPANIEEAIVVSGVEENGAIAKYSNYGETIDYAGYGTYEGKKGTSYATANVTGIIAELLTKEEDISILDKYAEDRGEEGKDKYFGNGFIGLEESKIQINSNEIPKDNFESTIFDVDWKNLSDEYLNQYLSRAEEYHLAVFLQSLSQEELDLILSKNTTLVYDYIKYDYKCNEIFRQVYWKYLLNIDELTTSLINNQPIDGGKFHLQITGNGKTSNVTFTIKEHTLQEDGGQGTLTFEQTGTNNHNIGLTKSKVNLKDSGDTYDHVDIGIKYTQPKGYKAKGGTKGTTSLKIKSNNVWKSHAEFNATGLNTDVVDSNTVNIFTLKMETGLLGICPFIGTNPYAGAGLGLDGYMSGFEFNGEEWIEQGAKSEYSTLGGKNKGEAGGIYGRYCIELEPVKYTITYNANGGTERKDSQEKTHGTDITLKNNEFIAPKGYHFKNWNTKSDGEGDSYNEGATYSGNNDLTLYAQWTPITYNIIYDLKGGAVSSANPTTYNIKTDTITLKNPTKTGYTFTGWTGSNGTTPQTTVKIAKGSTGDKTYIANWEINKSTLTVNPNGGIWEGSTASRDFTQNYNTTKSIVDPTRTGYIFNGWTITGNAGTFNSSNKIFTYGNAKDGKSTLTANWIPITYIVEYNKNNPNNNAQVNGTMQNSTFTYSIGGALRANAYTRNAWTWSGWKGNKENGESLNITQNSYSPVLNWATNQNHKIILYAQWQLNLRNINGQVNWEDQNNKYSSRPDNVTVRLDHDTDTVAILKEADKNPIAVEGNSTYTFTNVQAQKESNNQNYIYTVSQNVVPGYETTINGYNITNKLILPTYTSSVTYTPINTFENRYLKNGKVKVTAETENTGDSRVGLHNGVATFTVDEGITIDQNKIKINFYNASTGVTKAITNYTLTGNIITVSYGENAEGISQKGDKITIEIEGTLNKIGNYSSNIKVEGQLKDLRGVNTEINLGQVTQSSATIEANYQMPKAKIKIIKKDSITEENLTDATFTLYEWNEETKTYKEIEKIQDTNSDGIYESQEYEWNNISQGKYQIIETGVPANHKDLRFTMQFIIDQLQTQNYTITPDYTNTNGINDACPDHKASKYEITYEERNPDDFDQIDGIIENEPYKIKARIDLLDSQTLQQIQNQANFKIYEWDNQTGEYKPYTSYTTGKEVEMTRLEDKTYIVGEWLYYTQTNEGKYRIVEETAPEGYYGDYEDEEGTTKRTYDLNVLELAGTNGQSNEMTITLTNDTNGTFTNKRTKAEIKINKVDSQTKGEAQVDATLEGAEYEIYASQNIYHADGITTNYPEEEQALLYKDNELITTKTTNEEGKLTFENLECGIYYIKEKTASEGYLVDKQQHDVNVEYRGQEIILVKEEKTYEEKVKKQGFQIYKIKQTDRTEYEGLENAGFTIYRINDLSIVKEGKITKNIDGTYSLNDEEAKKDSNLTSQANKNGTYNIKDLVDHYYKIKYTEENKEKLPQNQTSYFPYKTTELETAKVKNYENSQEGEEINELKTDVDGYIRSPELAYGEYIVIETTVPKELEAAKPIYINIENDTRIPQKLKFIEDANFAPKIKIYKKDQTTGKTILQKGTKYVIYDKDDNLVTTKTWDAINGYVEYGTLEHPFETSKEGYLVTPMKLEVGNYTLKEIEAPTGYVVNGHEGHSEKGETIKTPAGQVNIQITTNGIYYTDDYLGENIIVIEQQNKPQVGTLILTSKGEYIKEANVTEEGNYEYTYETKEVEGVVYQIKAKENITTKDGHEKIIYQKDQIVQTITSNKEGKAYAENLPQGKYYIKQITAGEGFALNKEEREIEIKYGTNSQSQQEETEEWKKEAQETPVVYIEETYQNQRQNLKVEINKQDGETGEAIEGTLIGVYTKEKITNKETNETIIEQDTLVKTGETNEEGQIIINLPLGNYYVKEIKASQGYIKNNQTNNINGIYDTSQKEEKEIKTTLINNKTKIEIEKQDTKTNTLEGTKLELRNEKNETIEKWETEKTAKTIKGLKTNEQYKIVETKPSSGYVTANEITFTITEEGEIETEGNKIGNKIIMQDETTKVQIELLDKETKEYVKGAILQIVKIEKEVDEQGNEILDEEGNVITKEIEVAKWTSEEKAHKIEKLEIGKYKLKEEKAPTEQGYVQTEEIEFEIKDTSETQRIEMLQERTKLEISLKDKETGEQVEGAILQIIKQEKELDEQGNEIVDEEGKVQTKETIVEQFTVGKAPYYIEKLAVGEYILREIKTPTEKGYATIEDLYFKIEETKEIQKVEKIQDETKLEVHLQDSETGKQVEGASLEILRKKEDGTEEKVREITTTNTPYYTEKLAVGIYILRQTKTPEEQGYVQTEEIEFEIKDKREIQEVKMKQNYTKVEIEVIDKETKEKVEGIKIEIYEAIEKEDGTKEKGNKVREFETGKENYKTERLAVGKYILVEIEGQVEAIQEKGYVTIKEKEIEIKNTKEEQKITIEQDYTKLEIEVVDKITQEKLEGIKFELIRTTIEKYEEGNEEKEQIKEEVVEEFETGKENHYKERLAVGTYKLRQKKEQKENLLNKGYVTLKDIEFEIKDESEIQKLKVEQDYTKVEIEVVDKETKEKVEGIKIEIYEAIEKEEVDEQGNIVVDEQGNPKTTTEKGKLVREFETGKENYYTEKLGVGKYVLIEKAGQVENLLNKGYITLKEKEIEVKDTEEVQKITIEQEYTKVEIEIIDKETKEKIEGITIEIIKQKENGEEEVIKEKTTTKEGIKIEKLGIGEYILREKEKGVTDKGYVRTEDIKIKIQDTEKIQKAVIEQDYTKVEIKVVDKDTKEEVIGATIEIEDAEGNKIEKTWVSTKEGKELKRLPVGEYYIKEKEAPTLKGYVKTESQKIKVEETSQKQNYEFKQDYTKAQIKVVDEETKEELKEIELIVKDEKGKEVAKIEKEEEAKEENKESIEKTLKKLPVGKYTVESKETQYGYKQIKGEIEIQDKQEIQKYELKAEREPFDIEVKEWIGKIERNGAVQYTNKKEEQVIKKLDIKDKNINKEEIKITYKIRVKNISKIRGQVGKVEVSIPQGMKYVEEDNKKYWKEEGGKIVTTGLAGRELKEGSYAELEITLRWKNGLENFGTKETEVEIKEVTSDIGYKEERVENNKAKASGVIIGVSTGEMNLVWACWILLISLILLEIYVTKKLKVKGFKIKDRTLKYRKKNK